MVEQRKANIKRIHDEVWNKGNLDVIDEFYAPNFVQRRPPFPDIVGLEAYKENYSGFRSAFHDMKHTIEDIIVEGDKDAIRYTYTATVSAGPESFLVSATGKKVNLVGIIITHWVGGKIVDEWHSADHMSMQQQLGITMQPGE